MGMFSDLDIFIREIADGNEELKKGITEEVNNHLHCLGEYPFYSLSEKAQEVLLMWEQYEINKLKGGIK